MANIKLESGWFLIENKVLFGPNVAHQDYINLALESGEDLINEKVPYMMVEFPWEYDIQWINIKCISWKEKKLNYLVRLNDKKYAIIQSPKILEEDEVSGMDYRLYTDEKVEKKIDQLELEWKTIKLNSEWGKLQVDMKDDKSHEEVDIKVSNTKGETPEVEV